MKYLRRLIPYTLVITTLVIVFPLLCGCSGEDNSNRFLRLLKLIPSELKDSPEPLLLTDLASYYEDYDISLTDSEGNPITFEEYFEIIKEKSIRIPVGGSSYITGYGKYAMSGPIQDKYLGYDFTRLDAEIQAGHPPVNTVAAIGRYDSEATRDALSHQEEWPSWAVDAYTTEEYRGVTIHSWGDGFEIHMTDTIVPPHIDELGRARPLAVIDDYLFYGPSLEAIKSMIDASQGKTESLADLPEFAELADKLHDLNVYSLVLGIESMANGDPEYQGTYPGPRLKRFETFGSASGEDENGIFAVLVLYHENPEDARSNVALLEQRIAETDSLYDEIPWAEIIATIDIHVEDNLLVAKLYSEHTRLWANWIYGRNPLLLHET